MAIFCRFIEIKATRLLLIGLLSDYAACCAASWKAASSAPAIPSKSFLIESEVGSTC